VTLLMSIDITLDLSSLGRLNLWAHYLELATLDVMALVVGWGVETQRLARHRAEAAETRYRQLYETAPVPILVLDAEGVVRDANPTAQLLFGKNVVGCPHQSFFPGGFLSEERAGQVLSMPDGRDYRLELVAISEGTATSAIQVILEDVTEERNERRRATRYAQLMVQAEEDQRGRLSRELHDEPLQLFLYLARRLEHLGGAPGVPAAVSGGLAEARRHALDAATRLRSVARDLRPPELGHLGLVAALSSLLADIDEEEADLETELQVTGNAVHLDPEVELGVFRIIKEAVSNTLRHAGAHRLQVTVGFGVDELALTVVDDGRGFTPEGLYDLQAANLGMLGMRERATLLGGHLEVRSEPGTGTVVDASVPLPSHSPSGLVSSRSGELD
jgi:two-component system, NarL family, sensor histidine kinase UhpB